MSHALRGATLAALLFSGCTAPLAGPPPDLALAGVPGSPEAGSGPGPSLPPGDLDAPPGRSRGEAAVQAEDLTEASAAPLLDDPSPDDAAAPAMVPNGGFPRLALVPVARGLDRPVAVAWSAAAPGVTYVATKAGVVYAMRGGEAAAEPFLDLRGRVRDDGEGGLLDLAFDARGMAFVSFTDAEGRLVVERFGGADPLRSGRGVAILVVPVQSIHHGGALALDADGLLHVSVGDGDQRYFARLPYSMRGKVLRVDPLEEGGYAVPPSNPFATGGGLPEVWAMGLRNPWRMSLDQATGELWIGDVGEGRYEEVDAVPPGAGGIDFGWPDWEGPEDGREPAGGGPAVAPRHAYAHVAGRCAVIGGHVYRGAQMPWLQGAYLFGDFCTGQILALQEDADGVGGETLLADSPPGLVAFGLDGDGEVYAVHLGSGIDGAVSALLPAER